MNFSNSVAVVEQRINSLFSLSSTFISDFDNPTDMDMLPSALVLLLCCIAVGFAAPNPRYGKFAGSLPDPQKVGIRGDVYKVNETTIQVVGFSYNGHAPGTSI